MRVLWCISFIVSTLYSYVVSAHPSHRQFTQGIGSYTWDFLMDWGLGRWHSRNFPLRDELFYAHRCVATTGVATRSP